MLNNTLDKLGIFSPTDVSYMNREWHTRYKSETRDNIDFILNCLFSQEDGSGFYAWDGVVLKYKQDIQRTWYGKVIYFILYHFVNLNPMKLSNKEFISKLDSCRFELDKSSGSNEAEDNRQLEKIRTTNQFVVGKQVAERILTNATDKRFLDIDGTHYFDEKLVAQLVKKSKKDINIIPIEYYRETFDEETSAEIAKYRESIVFDGYHILYTKDKTQPRYLVGVCLGSNRLYHISTCYSS
jgi:hypothetical protein